MKGPGGNREDKKIDLKDIEREWIRVVNRVLGDKINKTVDSVKNSVDSTIDKGVDKIVRSVESNVNNITSAIKTTESVIEQSMVTKDDIDKKMRELERRIYDQLKELFAPLSEYSGRGMKSDVGSALSDLDDEISRSLCMVLRDVSRSIDNLKKGSGIIDKLNLDDIPEVDEKKAEEVYEDLTKPSLITQVIENLEIIKGILNRYGIGHRFVRGLDRVEKVMTALEYDFGIFTKIERLLDSINSEIKKRSDDEFEKKLSELMDELELLKSEVVDLIKDLIKDLSGILRWIGNIVRPIFDRLGGYFDIISRKIDNAKSFLSDLVSGVVKYFDSVVVKPVNLFLNRFLDEIRKLYGQFTSVVGGVKSRVLGGVRSFGSEVGGLFDRVVGSRISAFTKRIMESPVGKYVSRFGGAVGRVGGVVGKLPGVVGGAIGRVGASVMGALGGAGSLLLGAGGVTILGMVVAGISMLGDMVRKYGDRFSGYFRAYKKLFDVVMGLLIKPFADALGMLIIPFLKIMLVLLLPLIRNWNKALRALKDANVPMMLRPFVAPIIAVAYTISDIISWIVKMLYDLILAFPQMIAKMLTWPIRFIIDAVATFLRFLVDAYTWFRIVVETFDALVLRFMYDFISGLLILIVNMFSMLTIVIVRLIEVGIKRILDIVSLLPDGLISLISGFLVSLLFMEKMKLDAFFEILGAIGSIFGLDKLIDIIKKGVDDVFGYLFDRLLRGVFEPRKMIELLKSDVSSVANRIVELVINSAGMIVADIKDLRNKSVAAIDEAKRDTLLEIVNWRNETLMSIENWRLSMHARVDEMEMYLMGILEDWKFGTLAVLDDYGVEVVDIVRNMECGVISEMNEMNVKFDSSMGDIKSSVNANLLDIKENLNNTLSSNLEEIKNGTLSKIDSWTVESLKTFDEFVTKALEIFSGLSFSSPYIYSSPSPSTGYSGSSGGHSDSHSDSGYSCHSDSGHTDTPVLDGWVGREVGGHIDTHSDLAHIDEPVLDGWVGRRVGGHIDNYSCYNDHGDTGWDDDVYLDFGGFNEWYDPWHDDHNDYDDYYDHYDYHDHYDYSDYDDYHDHDDYSDYDDYSDVIYIDFDGDDPFQIGGEVPETGRYILHGGELVVPRWRVVEALVKMSDNRDVGGRSVNVNIDMTVNVNGNVDERSTDELAEKIKEKLMNELRMRGVF